MTAAALMLLLAPVSGPATGQSAQQPTQSGAGAAQEQTIEVVPETEIDRQVRDIASGLRCPICQGQSLQDSPSELAQQMRDVIRSRLEEGQTPDQVRDYFMGSYGEWILMEPRAKGFNLTVYVLPVLAVIVGALGLMMAARRWLVGAGAPLAGPTNVDESDPDLAAWEDLVPR